MNETDTNLIKTFFSTVFLPGHKDNADSYLLNLVLIVPPVKYSSFYNSNIAISNYVDKYRDNVHSFVCVDFLELCQ